MDLSIGFLTLVLLGLAVVRGGRAAQVFLDADLLLNQTETSVLELVNEVRDNALNSCALLSTCNAESTCSRLACPLVKTNKSGYECQGVFRNTNCKDNCPWRNFDFSRSFLRLPGVYTSTDEITQRQLREICAQRRLDSAFQKLSNSTNFFRVTVGSVDGTFRIYPGMDEADCGSYDPRLRIWYLTSATNVKKAVMVLIDSGSSMADIVPGSSNDSNLATAFSVTEAVLQTTTEDDYVNIFTFDQASVAPVSAQPVIVTNTSSHPDFGVFTATLSTPSSSSVPPGNITDAVSEVISSPAGFSSPKIPIEYLKVMILITDSKAVGAIAKAASSFPWDLIKSRGISVFVFMFPNNGDAIDTSPLAIQLCAANGSFTTLDETVFSNPLLALEPYFSFLANVHSTYVNSGVDYSTECEDYSQVDNRTFTLSKAVFTSNGELQAVAAISIFKTKLLETYGIDGEAIEDAVRTRANRSANFNASAGIQIQTCLNQTLSTPCNQTGQLSNIVCLSDFSASVPTLRKLSCCGACTDDSSNLGLILGLSLGIGIPVVAALLVITVCCFCKSPCETGARKRTQTGGGNQERFDIRTGFHGDPPADGNQGPIHLQNGAEEEVTTADERDDRELAERDRHYLDR